MSLNKLRQLQIKFSCYLLNRLSAQPLAFSVIKRLRRSPVIRHLLAAATGPFRPFNSLNEAASAIAGCDGGGFISRQYQDLHLSFSRNARPSDYAALFYLNAILPEVNTVFDFGGSVGNVYYCYERYLKFSSEFGWTVYDLPETLHYGKALAVERGAQHLKFSSDFAEAEGVDLFIASGSLHYFDTPLSSLIAKLEKKPRFILINRTPLVESAPIATVQKGAGSLVACMLHNRSSLIEGFAGIGYDVVDVWPVLELSLDIPCYPDFSPHNYIGMFLKLRREKLYINNPKNDKHC